MIWNWSGCLLSLIFLTRSWNCFLPTLLFYFDFENVLQIWWLPQCSFSTFSITHFFIISSLLNIKANNKNILLLSNHYIAYQRLSSHFQKCNMPHSTYLLHLHGPLSGSVQEVQSSCNTLVAVEPTFKDSPTHMVKMKSKLTTTTINVSCHWYFKCVYVCLLVKKIQNIVRCIIPYHPSKTITCHCQPICCTFVVHFQVKSKSYILYATLLL